MVGTFLYQHIHSSDIKRFMNQFLELPIAVNESLHFKLILNGNGFIKWLQQLS